MYKRIRVIMSTSLSTDSSRYVWLHERMRSKMNYAFLLIVKSTRWSELEKEGTVIDHLKHDDSDCQTHHMENIVQDVEINFVF